MTEHPDAYRLHIDARYRDDAPRVVRADHGGDVYLIPGMEKAMVPIGLIAAAGRRPEDISMQGRFEDWYPGGYEPEPRIAESTRIGISRDTHRMWRYYDADSPALSRPHRAAGT